MKKLISILLGVCLIVSLSAIPAMAADYSALIEESLTTEASFAITKNLTLLSEWDGTSITWESSNTNVITNAGVVTRPIADTEVTLTAKANDVAVKTLKFTVIGKGKKVWYSQNFNEADNFDKELGNRQVEDTLKDISIEYKAATESDPGRIGFINHESSANDDDIISVQTNPLKAGDGALCFETVASTTDRAVKGHLFFPDANNLPGGKVKLYIRVTSPENTADGACQFDFGFKDSSTTNYKAYMTGSYLTWMYKMTAKDITRGGNKRYMVKDMQPDSGYYSNLIEYETDLLNGTGRIISASNGEVQDYSVDFSSYKDASGKTSGLYFATTSDTSMKKIFIDDVVIMTDEIDASSDDEGVEIYKSLLTEAFESNVTSNNEVDRDFSLDLVNIDGYSVSWASNNTDAIVIDNASETADVALSEIIRPVTLTATITKGAATTTASFNLDVVPYGSTIKSDKSATEKGVIDFTGFYSPDAYVDTDESTNGYQNPYGPYKIAGNTNTNYNVNKDASENEYASMNNAVYFSYVHSGTSNGAVSGNHVLSSVDLCFGEPDASSYLEEGEEEYDFTAESRVELKGTSGATQAKIHFCYKLDSEGNKAKWIELYSATDGNVLVKDPALVPEPGEWVNLQIVVNRKARKFDVYIDGVKINNKALTFSVAGPKTGNEVICQFAFVKAADSSSLYVDNIQIRENDTDVYANAGADLMDASIASFSDTLATTGTNGSTIVWTDSGDAAISGSALTKTKAFGLGKGVATASVTISEELGTLSRSSSIEYGTGIKQVNNDGTKLTSVVYSAESAGKGYIALYNDEDRLLDVASFDVAVGTDSINFINKTLPTGYDSCKAFVWTSGLKPLGYVYP